MNFEQIEVFNNEVICGIYLCHNLINNKKYIGQSVHIYRRLREHLNRNEQIIEKAIKKYGKNNFCFYILETCPIEELDKKEKLWIQKFDSLVPNGYNATMAGALRGEMNHNSVLTELDVILIRNRYKEKNYQSIKELYKLIDEKISFSSFYNMLVGNSWSHIMPEVFTQENKDYYDYIVNKNRRVNNICGELNTASILTEKEVMEMRNMYINNTCQEIWLKFPQYKKRTIKSILSGQNWKHLPYYIKTEKRWVYPKEEK